MAKLNKYGRIFLRNLSKKYGVKISTIRKLKNAVNNGTIPAADWKKYQKLVTSTSAALPFGQMANEMGEGYLKKSSEMRKAATEPSKPVVAPTGATEPSKLSAPAASPTAPTKPISDKEAFYSLTGEKPPKTKEEVAAEKAEKGQPLLDPDQAEALKKVTELSEQKPERVEVGGGYDRFVAQQLNRMIPEATGQLAPQQRFGQYSDSNILNAYDTAINALSRGRTRGQEQLATASPYVTGAANIAGGAGGAYLGSLVGKPLAGAGIGSRIAGYGTQAGLGYLAKPKSRMSQIAGAILPQQGRGSRIRRGLGNLIGGQRGGLSNYFSSRFRKPSGIRERFGRFVGGQPTFSESLKSTMTDPNLASNVRAGIEGSIALYEVAEQLGLPKYAKRALNSITRRVGLGGLADRLGLGAPAAPTATGRETGEQHGGSIVEGLAGRHFPGRRQEIVNEYGYDPGSYGEQSILEGARGTLAPMEAAYDIKRAGLQRREREEGILGEGQRNLNRIQQQREAVRRRAQDQRFSEKMSRQDILDQEAEMAAEINAENRRLDTTGISLGQKTQPTPMRRQGYIPSPTSELIAEGAQRTQEVLAPYMFRRK